MKTRTMLFTLAFCLLAAVACFAAENMAGTWKLDDAKSKIPAGVTKNSTVTYTAEGDKLKCSIDGVDGAGKPLHTEWTGKFDGKDYPLTGDPNADSRAITQQDARHYRVTEKKDGKPVAAGTIVMSPDGKSRTVTIRATSAKGQRVTSTAVYEKE